MKDKLDELDRRLLHRLMRNGRATWADLAEDSGLTAPAIAQRVRRLEERGVIQQFAAWVAADTLLPVAAYVGVTLGGADHQEFREAVRALDFVQECSHVASSDDYVLKVRCASVSELEEAVTATLRRIQGVTRVTTTVILATVKATPVLPIPGVD